MKQDLTSAPNALVQGWARAIEQIRKNLQRTMVMGPGGGISATGDFNNTR